MVVPVLAAAPHASAAWASASTGLAAASATYVQTPAAPSAVSSVGRVTLSWSPVTLANGQPVEGYRVLRHVGATTTQVCATTAPATTCDDASPVGGTVEYGVVATRGRWSGAESPLRAHTHDATPPVTTIGRSPAGNDATWHRTDVQVTLTATDAESGVKEVRYAVNGGAVQVVAGASAVFTVSREDANALAFWAVDNLGNVESAKAATVRVDKTAPVSSATLSSSSTPVAGWYASDVTVTLSGTDPSPVGGAAAGVSTMQYQLNGTGGSWTTATAPVTVSTGGATTVWFRGLDGAGNVETARSTVVRVDKAGPTFAPAVTSGTAGANGWYAGATAPVVKLDAADADSGLSSVEYQIGGTGGPWLAYSDSAGITVPESAAYQIFYRGTDNVGNVSVSASPFVVKYDRTAPAASHAISPTTPNGSNGWYKTAPTVTITASDVLSGLDTITWWVNSVLGFGAPRTASPASFVLPDGTDVLTWTAADKAGNTVSGGATYKVDATAPSVSVSGPVQGGSYAVGNTGAGSWATVCSTGRICATVSDAASGIDTTSATYLLRATSGTNNGKCWTGSAWTSGSGCAAAMSVSGTTATGTAIARSKMNAGTYVVTVTVRDLAGNTSTSAAVSFTTF